MQAKVFFSSVVELYKCEKCLQFEVANLIKLLYWLETYEPASPKLHFCKWGLIQFAPSSYQTCKWISFVYLDFCLNERNSFCMLDSKQGNVLKWLRVFCEFIEGLNRRGKFEWVFFRTVTLESSLAWV